MTSFANRPSLSTCDEISKATVREAGWAYHGVDSVLELVHDDAVYGDSDLLTEITVGDGVADTSDVLDLSFK